MKKKILVIISILLLAIATFILYINKFWIFNPYFNKDVNIDDIINAIEERINMPAMTELEISDIEEFKSIDLNKIENYKIYTSFMNITADEIIIFKVRDKNYLKTLEEKLIERADLLKNSFESYVSSQKAVIDECEIKIYNNTIILVISEDKYEILDIIDNVILNKNI